MLIRATEEHLFDYLKPVGIFAKHPVCPQNFTPLPHWIKKISIMLLYCLVLSRQSGETVLLKSYGIQLQESDMKKKNFLVLVFVMGTFMMVAIPPICTWHSCLWKIVIMWTSWDSLRKAAALFFKTILYMQTSYMSHNWVRSVVREMLKR